MTTRGKIVLTILVLGVVGLGVWKWWDKSRDFAALAAITINLGRQQFHSNRARRNTN